MDEPYWPTLVPDDQTTDDAGAAHRKDAVGMSDERYPADLAITEQDFRGSGWKDILSKTSREGYSSMWQALSAAARQAMDEGRPSYGKVLWLLADACSMRLAPNSVNEPFKPFMVMEGRRSVIPDDLSESDVAFYAQVVDAVDDPWLRARLADLAWLKQTKREVRFALAAIDAYRLITLDTETWVWGGRECWARAIQLARMLREAAGDRVAEIETAILKAFESATTQNGFLGLGLADLLELNGLGRAQRAVIALKLESLAGHFDADGELHRAREHFSGAAKWFKLAGDETKAASMTACVAESWVKEAAVRVSSTNPSHMAAAAFYENAIQIYRTIPGAERTPHRVDERLAELRAHLSESGEKSLAEMGRVCSPGVDLSKLVENARNAVSGKTPIEALNAFCNLHHGVDAKQARESALEGLRNHPLQALLPATVMSRDGRMIAKRPGLSLSGASSEGDEVTIRAEMIRNHGILIGIVVQGDIWPALEILWLEHRLHEADFVSLASQSPIVPKDRVRLFGKALFAGYDRDFVTALHLLVPQIEHLVRHHLKQSGVKTTSLDLNGIENEIGLSSLMGLPEVEKIFGANLSFEICALFCDPFGPNLRNELAHGLLDDDACQSIYSIYAWWFGLRLVFNTFWNATRRPTPGSDEGQTE